MYLISIRFLHLKKILLQTLFNNYVNIYGHILCMYLDYLFIHSFIQFIQLLQSSPIAV